VPKVHPATRPAEADDPFLLRATAVGGDVEVMIECLVREYAWLGWDAERLLGLFRDPAYPMLNAVLQHYGEEGVRRRVEKVLQRTGVFRVSGVVSDEPEPADEAPELFQLGVLARPQPGDDHGQGV
jgi:hypothetical protein